MIRKFLPKVLSRLNYANVIATVALFVALGGAAVAAGLPKNSVGPNQIKKGAISAAKLKKNAVVSGKIAPKAVTAGKLGANAVLPGNIGNGAIATDKIAAGAVIASTIKNGVITTNKLANANVTTPKLGDAAVTTAKLAEKSVGQKQLSFEVATPGTVSTLKTGQTLRGVFDVGGVAVAAKDIAKGSVTYPMPLVNPPAVNVLKPTETNANCAGLGGGNSTPAATAGNLCVYLTAETKNVEVAELTKFIENNLRLGFGISAKATAAGEFAAIGQWAVTAP
jgi:hypothetical protein